MKCTITQNEHGIQVNHNGAVLDVVSVNLKADCQKPVLHGTAQILVFEIESVVDAELSFECYDPISGERKEVKRIEFEDGSAFEVKL